MIQKTIVLQIACFLLLVLSVSAVVHEITIYQELDQQGESATFQLARPSLTQWRFFLLTAKSYCATGWFTFYEFESYIVGNNPPEIFGGSEERTCGNSNYFATSYSARYIANANTDVRQISFYEDRNFGGREYSVTGIAGAGIPFTINSMATSGFSNWTLFEGENFNGPASCYRSTQNVHTVTLDTPARVGSLFRDCDLTRHNITKFVDMQ